ncbi:MAG: MBL fold metallo-hydrolase [Elusimicrobiota bacterium]
MALIFKQFEIGPMQNFGYLIGDDQTKEAFIVDPAWAPDTFQKEVNQLGFKLTGMIITHAHYDHTNAIEEILVQHDIPVYANKAEITYSKSGTSIVASLGKTVKGLEGGEKVKIGETELTFLHTPGHTPGSQCIQVGDNLITGDTLFMGGCGRADLPGGDGPTLFKSLQKIATLPSHLVFWPGHDYGFIPNQTLEKEKKSNPYLQMQSNDEFLQALS